MSKWEMVRLGDVGCFQSGGTPTRQEPKYFNGNIPWITTVSLGKTYIDENDAVEFITEEAIKNSATKRIPPNSLMIGIRVGVGKVSVNRVAMCTSQDILSIINIDETLFANDFLVYCIKSYLRFFNDQKRGATIQGITSGILKDILIPVPPLETQQKIARALDAASELRALRKQQLAELDKLIKSIFYELFGDPVVNEKGWPKVYIGKVATLQGGFAFKSPDYVADGVRLVKISNVHYGQLTWDDISYLPINYLDTYSNFSLDKNDILMAMTRPIIKSLDSVKIIKVTGADLPCLLNQRVGRFKIIVSNALNHIYLYWFCLSRHFKNEVERYSNINSLQPNISSEQIETINMILPPLQIQNQFAEIVIKIEEQKALVQKSVDEGQYLFDSLMSEYFE